MKKNKLIASIFKNIGQISIRQNNEPKIEFKRDRYGNSYWKVYDFPTNKSYAFGSEQDVRAWIENRYHSF